MTLFEPTLILKRLRVEKDNRVAYDEKFHKGVNIIRGDNSSGKSTILNLIYYSLGGDLSIWSDEALGCTHVVAEVELNGNLATFRREISEKPGRAMEIFGGSMSDALMAPIGEWLRFPYTRSSKESFSQAIFRLLDVPEAASEGSGNITMHQILRLLYADQLSPAESLFKHEGRWDTPTIRDAVGRLLCGAKETTIYENQIRLRALDTEWAQRDAALKSLYTAYGRAGESLTPEWIELQKASLNGDVAVIDEKIKSVERSQSVRSDDSATLQLQNEAYQNLMDLQLSLANAQSKRDSLSMSILDIEKYSESQRIKLAQLQDSEAVAKSVGTVVFDVCPICLEPIVETDEHACHLCKTPVDPERLKTQFVALINESNLQIRQAEMVMEKKRDERDRLEVEVANLRKKWQVAASRFSEVKGRPSSESQAQLRKLYQERGYLERQIEDQERLAEVVDRVRLLSDEKEEIGKKIAKLKVENERLEADQEKRLSIAYTAISDNVRSLLREDLPRQDSFKDPKNVDFDFGANRISVDGHVYFSASSRVVLKTSFIVGFMLAAAEHAFFRHPRFCLIDTIEDKGMEEARSQNYQELIAKRSSESDVDHQIIFATSMIAPSLENDNYTIGKYSTLQSHTLDV